MKCDLMDREICLAGLVAVLLYTCSYRLSISDKKGGIFDFSVASTDFIVNANGNKIE